jgi:hypothetical protein
MAESADTAKRLAEAANTSATQGNEDAFNRAFAELKPSADDIAGAICILTTRMPGYSASREMLAAHLQLVLTREQIAAQERMGNAATRLTAASVVLGIVALLVTLLQIVLALK